MIRRFVMFAFALAVGVAAGASSVRGAAQAALPVDAQSVIDQVRRSVQAVGDLVVEYEPVNDVFVLRCLRDKLNQLQVIEAVVLAAAAGQALAPAAIQDRDERCREFPSLCAGSADQADPAATVAAAKKEAQRIEQEARGCLSVDSGQVVDYAAADVAGELDPLPRLDMPEQPLAGEPEPLDRPLSPVEF